MSPVWDLIPTISVLVSVGFVAAAIVVSLRSRSARSRTLRRRVAEATRLKPSLY